MNINAGLLNSFSHTSTIDDIVRLDLNIDAMSAVEYALFNSSERVVRLKDFYVEMLGDEHLDFATLDIIAPLSYWAAFCERFAGEDLGADMDRFFYKNFKSQWILLGMA